MNYRLITRWEITEEVKEQYFSTSGDAKTITDYLDRAIKNGGGCLLDTSEETRGRTNYKP